MYLTYVPVIEMEPKPKFILPYTGKHYRENTFTVFIVLSTAAKKFYPQIVLGGAK